MLDIFLFLFYLLLISFPSISYSKPHFTFDGIESYHNCSGYLETISFTIYGSLNEELNPETMFIKEYLKDYSRSFNCSLEENPEQDDEKRTHKITCTSTSFLWRSIYILEEPEVSGFDFLNEEGETTWPNILPRYSFPQCNWEIAKIPVNLDQEKIFSYDFYRRKKDESCSVNLQCITGCCRNDKCVETKKCKEFRNTIYIIAAFVGAALAIIFTIYLILYFS